MRFVAGAFIVRSAWQGDDSSVTEYYTAKRAQGVVLLVAITAQAAGCSCATGRTRRVPAEGRASQRGDVMVTNHPQLAGGSHLPDITVITPVFEAGSIVFYVASRGQGLTTPTMHVPASHGPSAPLCGQRRRAAREARAARAVPDGVAGSGPPAGTGGADMQPRRADALGAQGIMRTWAASPPAACRP